MNCLERMASKTRNTVHCTMCLNESMRKCFVKRKREEEKTKEELDHDFDTYYESYKQCT